MNTELIDSQISHKLCRKNIEAAMKTKKNKKRKETGG